MSLAMVLKIFSDCCVVFALLGSGPVQFETPLLVPALLCGIAAGLATFFQDKGRTGLRYLCALLPFGCLLLDSGTAQMLILAVPAAYTALVILRNKLELEYYAYRRFFQQSLLLVGGAYLLANVWLFFLPILKNPSAGFAPEVILRYGLVHLLCGVVLQRQLRLGVGNQAAGGKQQMVTMLGVTGAIATGFVVAEPLLRQGVGSLFRSLLMLLMIPVMFVVEIIQKLIDSLKDKEIKEKTWSEYMETVDRLIYPNGRGEQQGEQPAQTQDGISAEQVWMIIMVVLLIIVVVLALRALYKYRSYTKDSSAVTRVVPAPKKKKDPRMSNRSKVRQAYKEFLRRENELGLKLQVCDTSGDVLERIHKDTDPDGAAELRQVYLAARYDERRTITRGQAEQAKRALKATRMKQ